MLQIDTFAYRSWFDGLHQLVPKNLHMSGYLGKLTHGVFVVDLSKPKIEEQKGAVSSVLTQSRWHVLLLGAWCFHDKWDGRWKTRKIERRRRWCCSTVSLVYTSGCIESLKKIGCFLLETSRYQCL